jgi:hypothetical protein
MVVVMAVEMDIVVRVRRKWMERKINDILFHFLGG